MPGDTLHRVTLTGFPILSGRFMDSALVIGQDSEHGSLRGTDRGNAKLDGIPVDLGDEDLFGNDAAEDEDEQIFQSYALVREEVRRFAGTRRIALARAYKGEGKSALLRLTRSAIAEKRGDDLIAVQSIGSALSPDLDTPEFPQWVRRWKAAMCRALATEIGSRIGVAWKDDAMSLVEEAEQNGFRERGFVSSIIARFRGPSVDIGTARVSLPEIKALGTPAPDAVLKRWLEGRDPVWLFVDDVDQNFQNTELQRARCTAFFVACRQLVNQIPEVRVRAAVRPNVWTTFKMEAEALSHVEQYATDLRWDADSFRAMLSRRIEGYLARRGQLDRALREAAKAGVQRETFLLGLVFEPDMRWGRNLRSAHVILHTLSMHRPRWMIELCKLAAARANLRRHPRITRDDIVNDLAEFGRRRIQDTVAEFRSQCPEVEELLAAFRREPEEMTTDHVLRVINGKILNHLSPRIVGIVGATRPQDVAAFLYQIGFIFARLDNPDGSYAHATFADRPELWRSRVGAEAGVRWEVHPVFRQVLEIRDLGGREVGRARNARR